METAQDTTPGVTRAANIDDRARPRFVATGATHTGRLRPTNEDAARIVPELGLCLVADGVSGGGTGDQGGAEAAQLAVEAIAEHIRAGDGLPGARLSAAIDHADRRIGERGQAIERPEMCTTIVALLAAGPHVAIAHVGDSRAYRLRGGVLEQLTTDHTEVALWEQMHGKPAPPNVRRRFGHVIYRALGGTRRGVRVDVRIEPWRRGDLFLLCSDGLHGLVNEAEMARTIEDASSLDQAVVRLLNRANDAGGHDNITAVLVRMLG